MRTTPQPAKDIARAFPELADQSAQTIRLHPRRESEPGTHETKLGGTFLWPEDEPWPVCSAPEAPLMPSEPGVGVQEAEHPEHNDSFVTVLQLRTEDFPEVEFPNSTDILQLLWCPRNHNDNYFPSCKVYWRAEKEVKQLLNQMPTPTHPIETFIPKPCRLHPERVTEFPSIQELSDDLVEKLSQWEEDGDVLYQDQLSTAPGTKVGGYVDWIQRPAIPLCKNGHRMIHLLTIASIEFSLIPDNRWCPIEDQHILDGPAEERAIVQKPTGLSLGDGGSMYLFICRECADWPVQGVFQSR